MNVTAEKILNNKSDYRLNLAYLDLKYKGIFTKKLKKEKNEINVLSLFSEMEFGYALNQIFQEVIYEPNLNGKTPDWLVKSENENIIFEVKKINTVEEELNSKIELFKNDEYFGLKKLPPDISIKKFIPQLSKITKKEESYRELVCSDNYKLVICIDLVGLDNAFISDTDIREYLNFENKYSILNDFPEFCENVAGIFAKPIFGNKVFIENKISNFRLSKSNIDLINKIY